MNVQNSADEVTSMTNVSLFDHEKITAWAIGQLRRSAVNSTINPESQVEALSVRQITAIL